MVRILILIVLPCAYEFFLFCFHYLKVFGIFQGWSDCVQYLLSVSQDLQQKYAIRSKLVFKFQLFFSCLSCLLPISLH
jgi:hypothetical protein